MAESRQKILIFEDDPNMADLIGNVLRAENYEVQHAKSSRQGLDLMEQPDGRFDLVIMDLDLPDYDGLAACQMIRTLEDPRKAETPVIICTGTDSLEDRKNGFLVGAADWLVKGDFLDELVTAVKRVLRTSDQSEPARGLLVEPDRWIRHIIQQTLKEASILTVEAADTNNAIDLWRVMSGSIQLVFLGGNINMSQERKFINIVRESPAGKTLPIIAICPRARPEDVADFLNGGGSDYITKPFSQRRPGI